MLFYKVNQTNIVLFYFFLTTQENFVKYQTIE